LNVLIKFCRTYSEMLLTVKKCKLRIGRDSAYAFMLTKAFPSIRLEGSYFVREKSLGKWLDR